MGKKMLKKRVRWRCTVCKTTYDTKSDAIACTRLPVEPLQFKIGSKVRVTEQWRCDDGQPYSVRGRIVKIIGPKPPDEKYASKWLLIKGHVSGRHTFVYEVKFACPHCRKPKKVRFYAIELVRIR